MDRLLIAQHRVFRLQHLVADRFDLQGRNNAAFLIGFETLEISFEVAQVFAVDFQLGAAYAALGERVSKPFENTKSIDQLRIARARAFADKNCALIVK